MTNNILTQIKDLAIVAAKREDCVFYAIEQSGNNKNLILRVFIDHKDGVSLKHCSAVSEALSLQLDVFDPIKQTYQLEVSSPGLGRKLTEPWHFDKVLGKTIKLICEKENNKKTNIKAKLVKVNDQGLSLDKTGYELIQWNQIKKANLLY